MQGDGKKALDCGANEYDTKPINSKDYWVKSNLSLIKATPDAR